MRVRQGWSGEIRPNAWAKIDVDLDETDLRRILADARLPVGLAETLPLTDVFRLLENEAEFLVTAKLVTRYGWDDGRDRLPELIAIKNKIINRLKASGDD